SGLTAAALAAGALPAGAAAAGAALPRNGWADGSARMPEADDTTMLGRGRFGGPRAVDCPGGRQDELAAALGGRGRMRGSVPLDWVRSSAHSTRPTPTAVPSAV